MKIEARVSKGGPEIAGSTSGEGGGLPSSLWVCGTGRIRNVWSEAVHSLILGTLVECQLGCILIFLKHL